MPGNHKFDPFHQVKIAPKLEKSTDRDYNLIRAEGQRAKYQAIPAMHSPQTTHLTRFTKSKLHQN